jgi:perosamine synthetase
VPVVLKHQLPARSPIPHAALLRTAPLVRSMVGPPAACTRLSEQLQRDHGAGRAVVLTGSGTHALGLAIRIALRHHRGAPIALPAYSCFDLVTAAVAADARILFYDIDPETLSPDADSLALALQAGAAAVVASPLYGMPVDWDTVSGLVRRAGAVLIEDAAQSFGSMHGGRAVGAWGALTVLSFGRGKGWTGGGGGALLVSDSADAEALPGILAALKPRHGSGTWLRAAAASVLGRPTVYALPAALPWLNLGRTVYHPPSPFETMHAGTAALVLATHPAALREVRVRRINAAAYRKELRIGHRWRHITAHPASRPSWLRYPLRLPGGHQAVMTAQLVRAGAAPGYPCPLPQLGAAVDRTAARREFPGASELARTLITLPTHGRIARLDREQVRVALMDAAGKAGHEPRTRLRARQGIVTPPGVPAGE